MRIAPSRVDTERGSGFGSRTRGHLPCRAFRAGLLGAALGAFGVGCDAEDQDARCLPPELELDGISTRSAGTAGLRFDGGANTADVDCSLYRDQAGQTEIALTIRNERSTPVYIQPFRECNERLASLVGFERDAQPVNVRGFGCGTSSCEDVQANGAREPAACPAACEPAPMLVRIEPGAEVDATRSWREFVGHGISGSSERMPNACYAEDVNSLAPPGVECFTTRPLPAGNYRVTARAFTDLDSGDCVPCSAGTCVTFAQGGLGLPVEASTTLELPGANAILTFFP